MSMPNEPSTEEIASITASGFVGRPKELARISAAIEDSVAGRGRVLMLVGEPGIGKSRTADELAAVARSRGARVLYGRCHDGQGAPPFWPWRQIARSYIRQAEPKEVIADAGAAATEVARVVDDLRALLPDYTMPRETGEPEEARFRFFDGFTRFVVATAQRQPLVLILDDLHWADVPSLLLLQFMARDLTEVPLLIVGTYREIEVTADPTKAQVLGSLSRERFFERIVLGGLSTNEARALLDSDLGHPVPVELMTLVWARTEGNPFFLCEMARHLIERGEWQALPTCALSPTLTAPPSVRSVLRQRLDRLSAETLRTLEVAAVVGRDFDLAVLRLVGEANLEMLLARMAEAAKAGIVQPLSPTTARVHFAHSLVRDVLYEGVQVDRRADLHRRVGIALEQHWRLDLSEHADELAFHFRAAAAVGEAPRALRYCVLAAERATALLAYEEAIGSYRHALDVARLDATVEDATLCRLLLGLGGAQAAASDIGQMRDTFRRAAEVARRLDSADELARAAIGFARAPAVGGIVNDTSIQLLEEAAARLPPEDGSLRAALLSMLADALHHSPDSYQRRLQLCHAASDMARRLGDASTLARTLYDRHNAVFGPDSLEDRINAADELLHLARETRDRPMLLRAHFCRIINFFEAARVPAAVADIGALERLAKELHEPWHHWYAAWFRAAHALMEGRFADGERLALEAFAHGERVAAESALQVYSAQIGMLRALQGRWAEMVPGIRGLVDQFPAMAAWRCALAYYCAESGDVVEARHHFEVLADAGFQTIPRDGTWMVSMSQLADVCVLLGDAGRAAILYDLLAPYADRLAVVDRALASSGVGNRYLGVLAMTMERWSEAEDHLTKALELHRSTGMIPWVTISLIDLATLWTVQASPQAKQARTTLDEAVALAEELGMDGLLRKAEGLRAASTCGAQPVRVVTRETQAPDNPPAQPAPETSAYIFLKEGDVWTLSFHGITCRLKDARGLHYLAYLLRHPGRSFHVTDLLSLVVGTIPDRRESPDASLSVGRISDRLPGLDHQARTAYRRRLADLEEALAEAQENNDPGAIARAQREMEMLVGELSGATRSNSIGERARVSITKRLRATLTSIRQAHPELARHLDATIKTGFFCTYTPDPRHPIDWQL